MARYVVVAIVFSLFLPLLASAQVAPPFPPNISQFSLRYQYYKESADQYEYYLPNEAGDEWTKLITVVRRYENAGRAQVSDLEQITTTVMSLADGFPAEVTHLKDYSATAGAPLTRAFIVTYQTIDVGGGVWQLEIDLEKYFIRDGYVYGVLYAERYAFSDADQDANAANMARVLSERRPALVSAMDAFVQTSFPTPPLRPASSSSTTNAAAELITAANRTINTAPVAETSVSSEQLAAQIRALLAQVTVLQEQIKTLVGPAPTPVVVPPSRGVARVCPALATTLARGSKGEDVANLQAFLAKEGAYQGEITAFFGPQTEAALRTWQAAQEIVSSGTPATTGWGIAGPRTRAAIRADCAVSASGSSAANLTTPFPYAPPPSAVSVVRYPLHASTTATSTARAAFDETSLNATTPNPEIIGTVSGAFQHIFFIITDHASSTVYTGNDVTRTGDRWSSLVTTPLSNGYYQITLYGDGATLAEGNLLVAAGDAVADLKVNGGDGPLTTASGVQILLSWILRNVSNCELPVYGASPAVPAVFVTVHATTSYRLSCTDAHGQRVVDTAVVNVPGQ